MKRAKDRLVKKAREASATRDEDTSITQKKTWTKVQYFKALNDAIAAVSKHCTTKIVCHTYIPL